MKRKAVFPPGGKRSQAAKREMFAEIVRLRTEQGLYPGQIVEALRERWPDLKASNVAIYLNSHGLGMTKEELKSEAYRHWRTSRFLLGEHGKATQARQGLELLRRGYSMALAAQALRTKKGTLQSNIARLRRVLKRLGLKE